MFRIYFLLVFLVVMTPIFGVAQSENASTDSITPLADTQSGDKETTLAFQNDTAPGETEKSTDEQTSKLTEATAPVSEAVTEINTTGSEAPTGVTEFGERIVSEPTATLERSTSGASGSTAPASNESNATPFEGNAVTERILTAPVPKGPAREQAPVVLPPGTFENAPAPSIGDASINGAIYEKTDGVSKACHLHMECYEMREPKAWCELKPGESWTGEGCFCDHKLGSCVVELRRHGTLFYTDCFPVSKWECLPNAITRK